MSADTTLSVVSSTFDSSSSGTKGGALFSGGAASLSSVTVSSASARADGGAVWARGDATLSGASRFTNTSAVGSGGAVRSDSGVVSISGAAFVASSATLSGGAVYGTRVLVATSSFEGCTAGLAVRLRLICFCSESFLSLQPCPREHAVNLISPRTAPNTQGGCIYGQLSVEANSSTFFNSASLANSGGAVCSGAGPATLTGCSLANITAPSDGGAVWSASAVTLLGCNVTLAGSTTGSGGAVFSKGRVSAADSTFSACSAKVSGGALAGQNVDAAGSRFSNVSSTQARSWEGIAITSCSLPASRRGLWLGVTQKAH